MKTLLIALLVLPVFTASGQSEAKEAFLSRWANTEAYTLAMLEAFPDSLMDYQPTDSVFTVREQFVHLINHLQWIGNTYLDTSVQYRPLKNWEEWSKATVKDHLSESFQLITTNVKAIASTDLGVTAHFRPANRELSRYELLYLLLDHTRNHTGQLIVYLRLNGIAPPRYQGW